MLLHYVDALFCNLHFVSGKVEREGGRSGRCRVTSASSEAFCRFFWFNNTQVKTKRSYRCGPVTWSSGATLHPFLALVETVETALPPSPRDSGHVTKQLLQRCLRTHKYRTFLTNTTSVFLHVANTASLLTFLAPSSTKTATACSSFRTPLARAKCKSSSARNMPSHPCLSARRTASSELPDLAQVCEWNDSYRRRWIRGTS